MYRLVSFAAQRGPREVSLVFPPRQWMWLHYGSASSRSKYCMYSEPSTAQNTRVADEYESLHQRQKTYTVSPTATLVAQSWRTTSGWVTIRCEYPVKAMWCVDQLFMSTP